MRKNTRYKYDEKPEGLEGNFDPKNKDFYCMHCQSFVSSNVRLAGVNNRNHCPYCLWSKHVDLMEAGDRLSACKTGMHPIGLTLKRLNKKYSANGQSEMMLIHQCTCCGKLSINRLAADDDYELIFEIYKKSQSLSPELLHQFEQSGIMLLTFGDPKQFQEQFLNQYAASSHN